jgi:hypothetical protein
MSHLKVWITSEVSVVAGKLISACCDGAHLVGDHPHVGHDKFDSVLRSPSMRAQTPSMRAQTPSLRAHTPSLRAPTPSTKTWSIKSRRDSDFSGSMRKGKDIDSILSMPRARSALSQRDEPNTPTPRS